MLAEQKLWDHRVRLTKKRRMIYFLFKKGQVACWPQVKVRSGWPGQYLDLGCSCCISLDSAAYSEHIGAFPDALAQFGQELLTNN